jgi:uncharacterized protein (TIGR03578 family)
MLKNVKDMVRIEGKGSSKELAMVNAFNKIQKEVMQKYGKIMLRIEPIDAHVVSAGAITYTEKFFFFFFPRKRTNYAITLDVEIEVAYMDQEEIEFKEVVAKRDLVEKATGFSTGS